MNWKLLGGKVEPKENQKYWVNLIDKKGNSKVLPMEYKGNGTWNGNDDPSFHPFLFQPLPEPSPVRVNEKGGMIYPPCELTRTGNNADIKILTHSYSDLFTSGFSDTTIGTGENMDRGWHMGKSLSLNYYLRIWIDRKDWIPSIKVFTSHEETGLEKIDFQKILSNGPSDALFSDAFQIRMEVEDILLELRNKHILTFSKDWYI